MEVEEWKIEIPSGQCPFAEFPYNFSQNRTDILCNIKRAKEMEEFNCEKESCPLKVEMPNLFEGVFLKGGEELSE